MAFLGLPRCKRGSCFLKLLSVCAMRCLGPGSDLWCQKRYQRCDVGKGSRTYLHVKWRKSVSTLKKEPYSGGLDPPLYMFLEVQWGWLIRGLTEYSKEGAGLEGSSFTCPFLKSLEVSCDRCVTGWEGCGWLPRWLLLASAGSKQWHHGGCNVLLLGMVCRFGQRRRGCSMGATEERWCQFLLSSFSQPTYIC